MIIFDNGSGGETLNYLKNVEKDSRLKKVVFSDKNLGVWKARQEAFRLVTTPFVCFIDNDVFFPTKWLEKMEKILEDRVDVGEVGPLKLSKHLKHPYLEGDIKKIWHECEGRETTITGQLKKFCVDKNFDVFVSDLIRNNPHIEEVIEIPTRSIGGCVMLTRSDLYRNPMINDCNYANFKYGMEDMDYSWSLHYFGYKVIKCIDTYIHHFEHSSVKENKMSIDEGDNSQSLVYFVNKWENFIIDWVMVRLRNKSSFENIKQDEFIDLILRVIPEQIPEKLKGILAGNIIKPWSDVDATGKILGYAQN